MQFAGLCDVLLRHPAMFGSCCTQWTDVYQEQNGIYTFDRQPKFNLARIAAARQQPAAYAQKQSWQPASRPRPGEDADETGFHRPFP